MELSIYQVDAFASRLFAGNPAAVCPLENWLPDDQLQAIAMENNLSETAFFITNGEHFDLRWFTPTIEVDLCGHATLATAHVLWQELGHNGHTITFHTRSGELTVRREEERYWLNFPADRLEMIDTPFHLRKGLLMEPISTFRGRDDFLVVLGLQEQVEKLQPDFAKLAQAGGRGVIVTAPGEETDFVSRCFYPNAGVNEDPVTGSAHTTLTPYWARRTGKQELTARQLSKRGGELTCRFLEERVEMGGQAVTFLRGKIFL